MRKKASFVLTLALIALGGLSAAAANYHTSTVGTSVGGETYSEILCQGYHDPQNFYRMNGLLGGAKTTAPYKFLWIGGECENGARTNGRGLAVDTNTIAGFCPQGTFVNGAAAYSTATAGIGAMGFSCNTASGQDYYLGQMGADYSGAYNGTRCARTDVAWGFFGGQKGSDPNNSRLDYYGLVCGPATR
jgi:hypothetical protein